MALANANRCSDLEALDRDYLRWTPSGAQFTVAKLPKTRTPGPPKLVHYSSLPENAEVCSVTSLRVYHSKTADRAATQASIPYLKKIIQKSMSRNAELVD